MGTLGSLPGSNPCSYLYNRVKYRGSKRYIPGKYRGQNSTFRKYRGQNSTSASYMNQAPKTCIILHHIWKYRGHLSYQATNEVVRQTMLKKGGLLSYHGGWKRGVLPRSLYIPWHTSTPPLGLSTRPWPYCYCIALYLVLGISIPHIIWVGGRGFCFVHTLDLHWDIHIFTYTHAK